ncbi:MAG TPA: hypothetical protein VMT86_20295 [Bryobacteraceae bacterium]|nr:hypothetical protein [Bryobacteraceae bacterium]
MIDPLQNGARRPLEVRPAAGFGGLDSATLNEKPATVRGDSVIFDGSEFCPRVEVIARYR